jgi:5-hydroxyisourate hydrolase
MRRLTTHVLDTTRGLPASGVSIELRRLEGGRWKSIASAPTNADGRCDAPILEGQGFVGGLYQLMFRVGDYFRARAISSEASPFLDVVPIRFSLNEDGGHYYVPPVVAPWSYSTYRGT